MSIEYDDKNKRKLGGAESGIEDRESVELAGSDFGRRNAILSRR